MLERFHCILVPALIAFLCQYFINLWSVCLMNDGSTVILTNSQYMPNWHQAFTKVLWTLTMQMLALRLLYCLAAIWPLNIRYTCAGFQDNSHVLLLDIGDKLTHIHTVITSYTVKIHKRQTKNDMYIHNKSRLKLITPFLLYHFSYLPNTTFLRVQWSSVSLCTGHLL